MPEGRKEMKNIRALKVLSGAALALVLAAPAFAPAAAEDSIYVPLFTYRTGPFAGSGTPIADGMHDYLTMLNERDGGIGGVKLSVDECETSYDTKKGLECYDSVKPKGPVMINPWSTGITLSLIPKASVDKIPILSMAYGLSASAKGDIFPWIFNPPATYWDGLSEILKYVGDGSIDKLKGKTIGYLYFDAGFGKEPIPMFQDLAKDFGFTLKLYPVAPASMQDQSAQWLDVRRDKPDFVVMFGWGAMNATAVKEAIKAGYPMEKFVSIWWPGEADLLSAGAGAKGFKTLNWHGVGADYPALQDIKKRVVDAGKSQAPKDEFGNLLYDRGVYNSVLIAEAIANAQKLTGKKVVNGADVRRGLETIDLDAARFKALGLEGFAAPLKVTCADHNSHSATFIQQWDGAKWVKITDPITPESDKVQPLIDQAAKAYAEKNAGWPARTEACDSKS
jgi:branched-chain amino acid transport system substrate-binding protein